jgi:hypothetical protein
MISVYRKPRTNGGFDVTLVNNEAVDMPQGNPWEMEGWERMDVDSVQMWGWTHADSFNQAEYNLVGRELILPPEGVMPRSTQETSLNIHANVEHMRKPWPELDRLVAQGS